MGLEPLTEQRLAAAAVEAFSAELRVVGTDTLANFKLLHILPDGGDNTDSFVAYQRASMSENVAGRWKDGGGLLRTGNKRKLFGDRPYVLAHE